MAKLNFPGSPTLGTLYTDNGSVWRWNGSSWVSYNSLDLTSQVSGALGTTFGGTGFSSYTVGDILFASTANSLGKLPSGATNYVLTSNGPTTAPSWQAVPPSAASSVAVSPTNLNQSFFITAVNTDNGSGLGLSTINSFVINPFSGLMTLPGIALTNGVNSSSPTTGSLYVQGGVGIGLSLSLGGTLQLFNGASYTSFVSSASGNTTYTLPATSPATGSSVLSSTSTGIMSWVPMVATGGDNYTVNVASSSGGTTLFVAGVNASTGSGLAVSSNSNLTYNTTSNTLNSSFYSGTWAGSTITTLYGGTGLSTYTKGDLLVGLGNTLYKLPVGTQGQLLQAFSSATSGVAWTSMTPPTYGAFYSTQSQTVYGVGITTPITLNSTYEAYNTQIFGGSGTSSRIQIQTSGTYNIQFSAQINLASGNQPKKGDLWFRINGVDVPQSTTEMAISGKDYQTVLSLNFVSYFAANDYFEIVMSSSDANYQVEALSGLLNPPRPDIPSMIVTVVPVTQIIGSSAGLGVSGVVSVNGLNNYIQYFATGRTGTDFNISSSSQTHTFNIPYAGIGATGLITSQAQTIGGAKTFANDTSITSTTVSTSNASGALTVTGGVGIGGSLYVASATAISGVTLDNGIITGNLTGFATTGRNINVNAANTASQHYILFSPNATGSGVAVSSLSTLTVNPVSNVLSIGTGTFAANGVSIGAASNTITTSSGQLNLDSVSGQTNINDNLVIQGNLTVQGTTITVDSTISTLVDPVIVLGSGVGGTHSTLDNNQDRGIEFRWSNSGVATTGFFGFSDTDGKFKFIPNASIPSANVYTGTAGTAVFGTVEATLAGNASGTAATYTNFYGTLVGTATTANNIHISSSGNAVGPFYLAMSSVSSGSGLALSTDTALQYNSASDVLSLSYLTGTAITATTSFSGQLFGNVTGTASTATYAHQSGYGITAGLATTATNVQLAVGSNATNHSVIFSPSATGSGVALSTDSSLLYNPNTDTLTSINFAGNLSGNVTGTATTGTNIHLASTGNAVGPFYLTMSSATSGAGVAISTDSALQYNSSSDVLTVTNISGTAITASTSFSGQLFGNVTGTASTATYAHQSGYGITAGTATTSNYAHQSGYGITAGLATTATNVNISSASNAVGPFYFAMTTSSSGSGVALSTDTALQYNSASDVLSLSYLTGTAITATTSFSGSLIGNVTGTATTSTNVHLSNATSNSAHRLVFSPANTGSGVALSSSAQISYNPSTFVLSSSGIAVTSSANSTTSGSGALTVTGGVGIGQSLSIDGRIQFFNGANYTAFLSAATANTVYTLPATSPATGSSVLQSTSTGIMSWVPLVASSSGNTSQNIVVNTAGAADVFHPVLFTPAQLASGSAVSSDSLLSYNASSDRLFVSGIFVTSGTASTSTFTGGLLVAGGLGVSGQVSFTRASLGFTGVTGTPSMAFIGATTSSYISLNVLSDNSLSFEGSSGQLFSIDNNLNTGEIFSVSDISGLPIISASAGQTVTLNEFGGVTKIGDGSANASSTTNAGLVVSGGLGVTGNAFIGGTVMMTNSTISSSTSTGALVVTGGVGIGGSLYTSASNANSISGVVLSNSVVRTGTWAATAITSFYGGTGHSTYTTGDLLVGAGGTLAKLAAGASNYVLTSNGAGSVPSWQAVPPSAASSVAVTTSVLDQSFFVTFVNVANGSGLGLTTTTSFVVNPSSGLVSASGLALTSLINSTSTSSGTLRVSGGLGLTGNAFIGGTINAPSVNQSNISNVYFTNGNITGTSVTATTIQGTLVGTATTGTNVHLASTGNVSGPFYLAMSASSTGSGVALSSDTSLQYNSASDVLTAPYVSGTAITATTSFSGQLFGNVTGTATTATNVNVAATGNVPGPFYIVMSPRNTGSGVALSSDSSLQYNTATDVLTVPYISGTAITASTSFSGQLFGDVTGTATTATYAHQSGYGITAGIATTARNLSVANASVNAPHTIYFGPSATGAGVAVSSNPTISFNPSSFILSTSGLAVTSAAVSTSSSTGALIVTGGVGIGGSLYVASAAGISGVSINNGVVTGNLTGTATTATYAYESGYGITAGIATTARNVHLAVGSNAVNHSVIFSPSTSGAGVALSTDSALLYNPNTDTLTSPNFSGNLSGNVTGNLTGTATTATNVHLATTANAVGPFYLTMSSSSTGTGIALSSDTALSYNSASDVLTVSYISGTAITASTSFSGQLFGDVTGTATTATYAHQSGYGITAGIATTARNINVANATTNTPHTIYFGPSATGSGIAVSSNPTISFNPSSFILSTSGLAVTATTASTNSTSGALVVTGGVGIGDSLFVAGNISVNSGTNGLLFRKLVSGNYGAIYSTNLTPSSTNYTMITDGASVNFNGTNGVYFNINNTNKIQVTTSNINIVPTTDSTSASTGAFTVAGGVGIGGSLYVASATGISGVSINNGVVIGNLTGTATTGTNIHLASTGNAAGPFYLTMSPSSTGTGVGLSSDTALSYNSASDVLTVSYVSGTAITASTSFSGQLFGNVTGTATTATYSNQSGYGITSGIATTATNVHLAVGSNAVNHSVVFSPSSTGAGVALSTDSALLYNPNTDTLTSTNFFGTLTGTATTGTNIHLASTGNAAGPFYLTMSSSSSGSGVALSSDTALAYNSASDVLTVSNISGTAITASTSFAGQLFGNVTGTATTSRNSFVNAATTSSDHYLIFSPNASGSGLALSSGANLVFNPSQNVLSVGNGTFAANGISVGAASNTITTASGNLNLDSVSGQTNINDNVVIQGNLTVQGTTLTVDSTISTFVDPVVVLGSGVGGTHSTLDNNQDRGIEFRWSNSGTATTGFFGFNDNDGKFRFIPNASISSSNVYTGTPGTAVFAVVEATLSGNSSGTASTYTNFYGSLTGTASTTTNIHLATTGNAAGPFYLAMSSSASGAGVALSSDTALSYNSASDVLTVSYISGTAITASTSFNGQLFGNVTGTASTATYSHQSGYGITAGLATTATNVQLAVGANAVNHSIIFSPSATGSGVALSTDSSLLYNPNTDTLTSVNFSGNLVGNVTGTATTSTNVHFASTGNAVGPFYLALSSGSSGSGFALSTDTALAYNSASDVLSVSYISGTSITASTSFSGQLFGNVTGTATTATYSHQSGYGITAGTATTAANVHLAVGANAVNHSVIFSPSATGSGIALSTDSTLLYNPNTDTLTSTNFAGNLAGNVTGTATTSTNIHLVSTGNAAGPFYLTMSSGASGSGIALSSDSSLSYNSATDVLTVSNISGSAITASTSFAGPLFGDVTGFATTARNVNVSNAVTNSAHTIYFGPSATGSGVALSSNRTISFNPSSFILSTSGLAVTATTVSTNSTSGALIVSGGVGIGGTLNIDGNVKINFTNHTAFNVADVFTIYPVNNFEGTNIKSNYSYAFNVQDKANNNRFTIDVGNNRTILSGNTFSHELRLYNSNQVAYTGFIAASSGTVTYTLPAGDGSANFLLTTNGSGVLSWSNISGLAVTNINGLTSSYQYLAFDYSGSFPSWSSSGATHTLNIPLAGTASTGLVSNLAQSFAGIKTFTNDVFVSSATASTWAANGSLRVQGGLGVSGQVSFNQAALGYTGATNPSIAFIGGTTGSPITLSVLSDNSLIFEGTSGKLFGINNNLSTGWIFNVGDISGLPLLRANADGNVTMAEYAGNVGIGLSNPAYRLHVTGSVGFTSSVGSTNTTTGALIVSGGVGIGQSISIGGRIQFFNGANFTAFVSSATGNTVYTLPATSPATGSSVLSSTSTGVMSWVPMAAIASTVNAGTANNAAYYATSSATISENSNLQFTGTGLSVGGNINSSSTRSGSLYVNGGFGITGNAFIGGTVNITNTTSATGVSTAALVVSGGLGVNGDVYVANSAGSKLSVMQSAGDEGGEIFLNKPTTNSTITTGVTVDIYQNKIRFFESGGSNRGFFLDITSGGNSVGTNIMGGASSGTVNSGTATYAAYYAGSSNAVSENANLQFTGTGVSVGGNINSSSTRSGSLYVSGGFGVTGNAFIGGTTTIQSNTASISTTSGALVVSGGVGIGGSLNILGEIRVGTDTFTKSYSGDINFDNGTVDTPGNRFYWRNNSNFGIDAYSSVGTGITKFRVVKEMGESGGAELFSIDRDATVYYHNPPIGSTVGLRHTGSGTTIYTLPPASPAIGTSYLVSDSTGVMSWIRPKRSYVLSFGAGFTPSANAADTVQINIPYAPDNVALNYLVKRIEFRNETVSGGTGLSFYLQRHTAGNATWTTANRIQAGSGASFEVGAAVYQASFTVINSSSGSNGLVASGDYVRLFFTTVGSAANVSISMTIEEQ